MRDAEARRILVETAVRDAAPALLAYFARRVTPAEDAADLLAETLEIVWRKSSALPDEPRPWMFGIARNLLLHHRRGQARRRALADRLRAELAVQPHPGFADDHAELHGALGTLDAIDREIIGLVHWDGFALVEVAGILRMKEPTVRSRYHRAKLRLRELLAPAIVNTNGFSEEYRM